MADLVALLQPRIADRESFREFVEPLDDQAPGIERDIAALCKVDAGVAISHPLESLLSRCRDGDVLFSDLLAEVMLLTLDRLELTLEAMEAGRADDHLKLPQLVGGLLQRMPGWTAAAEMVRQHHETHDGKGYPEELAGDAICAGAKILAIVDAFEAVTLKHSHRGQSRSLIRAIAEINACDDQFAAEWIEPFNRVIRKMLES